MRSLVSSQKKQLTMVKIIKTPIRAISKAVDLYVKGVSNFTNTYNRPLRTMVTTTESQRLPRSFSTSRVPYHDQPPESALVRSISTNATSSRANQIRISDMEMNMIQQRRYKLQSYASRKGVTRSCSIGMGRIDEDRASSFKGL